MCGINGFNFLDRKALIAMDEAISHRGPDAQGDFTDLRNKISLGHRRLAIIDLSEKGRQPMVYSHNKNKVVLVFNGEIYNFQDIKNDLISKGYKFNSNSDSEVILASYLEWGEDCVKKFNGMWAFCIYDPQKNIFYLSRDRIGKKPLYYFFDGNRFIFSSEIKAILKHSINPVINKDAVDLYFSLGFIPAPYSIYEKIEKLEQRQSVIFDIKNKTLTKRYYYDWPDYKPIEHKGLLKQNFINLIEDSVKKRMISDVPLGAFLSGGLDSSTIVNFAKRFNDKLNTYSIGFEGKYDETPSINIVKDLFKTNHHHKYFERKDFDSILDKIFYYYDEPFSDPSMFPTLFLSRFARQDVTVALSGDGGDEIFGGYPRYKIAKQIMILKKIPLFLRKILFLLPYERLKEGLNLSFLDSSKFYSESRGKFYKPEISKKLLESFLARCLAKTQDNLVEAVRLMDIYFYTLPDNFLTKVDRASMASSLEVRCPFLDYRLIEYSMTIPTKYKVSSFSDKKLFREIISEFLPPEIVNKKKQGFTPPINSWIEGENYEKEIAGIIEEFSNKKIISQNWIDFYKNEILQKNSLVHNNYKIRLLLFYKWYKQWIKSP